jgi:hypothetical protein
MSGERPPWKLGGFCTIIGYLVSSKRVSDFVPSPLTVADVMPGVTLGGFYAASYQHGDFGAVSEFSVFPALVRYKNKKGFFVPCSMTESSESLSGPKGAWGLRKEGAAFQWRQQENRHVLKIRCNGEKVIEIAFNVNRVALPIRTSFPFFHVRSGGVISYHADYAARLHFCTSRVVIPENSPVAIYGFSRKLVTTFWESTKIVLHPPESERSIVFARGASEGIYHVGQKPVDTCGVRKVRETAPPCGTLSGTY